MNFLVTYAAADQAWAEWIAWELEANGYTTMLLAWDPRPDGNFMPLMRDSVERADWIIVVVSAAVLASPDAAYEWTAALVHHTDRWGQLLPVRVEEGDLPLPSLLAPRIYVDLAGVDERTARARLLAAVTPGRQMPSREPPFPGDLSRETISRPHFPGQPPVRYSPLLPRPSRADEISFTAAYPGVVAPEVWYSLLLYIHLGRLQAEVNERIASRLRQFGLRPAVSTTAAFTSVSQGTLLRLTPEIPGVVFNPPSQEVNWLEDLQEVPFRLRVASDTAGRALLGVVEVHAGPLLVAQVPLSLRVRGAGERQERVEAVATTTAQVFASVFASYAHKDGHVVRAFAEAYRALGIDVLIDEASLRTGERWRDALLQLIEDADLFQLFWSEASSRSPEVAKEWRYALSLQDRKGERFIRPLYWTRPWPPPPPQLEHLQFTFLDLAALSGVAGLSAPPTSAAHGQMSDAAINTVTAEPPSDNH